MYDHWLQYYSLVYVIFYILSKNTQHNSCTQICGQEILKSTFVINHFQPWGLIPLVPIPIPVKSNINVCLCFSNWKSNSVIVASSNYIAKKLKTLASAQYRIILLQNDFLKTRKKHTEKLGGEKNLQILLFWINWPKLLRLKLYKVGISQPNKCLWSGPCVYVHVCLYMFNILRPESFSM